MEKVYLDSEVGEVILRKGRGWKRITLRVSPRTGVTVSMPWFVPYKTGLELFFKKKDWVLETIDRQRNKMVDRPILSPEAIEAMRKEAKRILPARLAELAKKYSFEYNQVRIKNNVSNWGSCSSLKNINLNLRLVTLPAELQDYVMLHELCHLKYLNHGPEFHALLESVCPGHRALARQMKEYKIK